jgi:hypothetical protein
MRESFRSKSTRQIENKASADKFDCLFAQLSEFICERRAGFPTILANKQALNSSPRKATALPDASFNSARLLGV